MKLRIVFVLLAVIVTGGCVQHPTAPQSNADWVKTNGPSGVYFLASSGSNLFAVTFGGIILSTDNGISWTPIISGVNIYSLAVSGTNIFAGSNGGADSTGGTHSPGGIVYISTNNGISWDTVTCDSNIFAYVDALAINSEYLFAGTNDGVFRSSDNGSNWKQVASNNVVDFGVNSATVIAVGSSGLYRSTDNGTNWTTVYAASPDSLFASSFTLSGSNLFVGTYSGELLISSDDGSTWKATNTLNGSNQPNDTVESIATNGNDLFAGASVGVFLSTDNGSTWANSDGSIWPLNNTGLGNYSVYSLVANDRYLFAGTNNGVWRLPLTH